MEGNQMKMRDAFVLCSRIIGANGIRGNVFLDDIQEAHKAITAALAAPPRQCDVGTAEEQAERFKRFCAKHHEEWKNGKPLMAWTCDCPCYQTSENSCNRFVWAQMPYEEEGAEHGKA